MFFIFITSICLSMSTSETSLTFPIKDCDNPDKEFLILLDCRDDLRNQIHQFSGIAIRYLKHGRKWRNLQVKYMTNTLNGLTELSQTDYKTLNSSADELEKNCSSDVFIDNVFETTRKYFVPKPNTIQISFIMLGQNLSTTISDQTFVQTMADRQDSERDLRRFFVIVAADQRNYAARDYILYTSTFQKTNLYDFFIKVCNANCTYNATVYQEDDNFKSNYHFKLDNTTNKKSADIFCQSKHNSYLTSPESKPELKFLIDYIFNMNSDQSEIKTILLGLMKKSGSKEFTWDSKNPFVLNIPGIFQSVNISEKDICVYINVSFKDQTDIDSNGIVIDKYHIQWFTVDCDKNISYVYVPCECHVIQPNDQRNEDYFVIHRDAPSFTVLPIKTFLYALNTVFFYDKRNETRFIASQTSAEIHKFECNMKKILVVEKLEQYACYRENFTINNHYNYSRIEISNNAKLTKHFNYLLTTKRLTENGYTEGIEITDYINKKSSEFNSTFYMRCADSTYAPRCIFAKYSSHLEWLGCSDNVYLQGCENFNCSTGYFKCPKSYCIPLYQVNDGVMDCPRGEDENVIFRTNNPQCTGHMVLKAYDMCLETDIWNKVHKDIIDNDLFNNSNEEYVCMIKCSQKFICFSSVTKNVNSSVLYFKSISISSPLFKISDILLPHSRTAYLLTLFKPIELRIPDCGVINVDLELKKIDTSELLVLDLSGNQITTSKQLNQISKLTQLRLLNLSYNQDFIFDYDFTFPSSLEIVDISNNKIQTIPKNMFQNLINLKHLNLSYNKFSIFIDFGIPANFILNSLDIRGIEMKEIHVDYFQDMSIFSILLASDYRLCCPSILGPNIHSDKCQAPSDVISTCNHIVGDTLKRVIIWIVGLLTIGGNGLVLSYRLFWKKENIFKTHILFVIGLAMSDFIMGVYLIIIASADIYFTNQYVLKEVSWRNGDVCHFAGFLSTLSSETSTFFICWITFDRFIVVKFPFDENITSSKGKYVAFISSWLLGFVLALIPAVHPDWEIYSSNGMCLALPLSTGEFEGWEYSFAIFVVLNFVLFLFIAVGQVAIFSSIVKTRRRLSCTRLYEVDNSQETALAKKLALVALTDFLCWFPIGIMGLLSIGGLRYSPDVYAWVAIFILPINSAVNPMLYTIPEVYKKFETSVRLSYQSSLKRTSESLVLENIQSPENKNCDNETHEKPL